MLTNSALSGDAEEARRLGVDAFFTKPIREGELERIVQTIEQHLHRSFDGGS